MRVFISSVRRGLEQERDALPGLLQALGHEPVRFEDFTAQATPSRESCLREVTKSEVYLLLLGPHYGHVFPETGQSATHDEYVAARTKGIPRLVFRKSGVDFEPAQEEFAKLVADYGSGQFYATFTSAVDLQPAVAAALGDLGNAPDPLTYEPLSGPITVEWLTLRDPYGVTRDTLQELHVVPLAPTSRSTRAMRELQDSLVVALRRSGVVPQSTGLTPTTSPGTVSVELPREPARYDDVRDTELAGVSVNATGQVSVWHTLPRDNMGAILDPDAMRRDVASALRLVGTLDVLDAARYAIAIGLTDRSMVAEGRVTGTSRTSATYGLGGSGPVRVEPDESVSAAAFDRGADEVADTLVTSLVTEFRRTR